MNDTLVDLYGGPGGLNLTFPSCKGHYCVSGYFQVYLDSVRLIQMNFDEKPCGTTPYFPLRLRVSCCMLIVKIGHRLAPSLERGRSLLESFSTGEAC